MTYLQRWYFDREVESEPDHKELLFSAAIEPDSGRDLSGFVLL